MNTYDHVNDEKVYDKPDAIFMISIKLGRCIFYVLPVETFKPSLVSLSVTTGITSTFGVRVSMCDI